jgi:predicted nucleic acid-binding protein
VYLLDTNVPSEVRKPRPDPRVMEWIRSVPERSLFLSTLTIGEIRNGIENKRRRDRPQEEATDRWLDQLCASYARRILPVTTEIAEVWGRLNSPNRIATIDGLLAATALVHDLTLVTRNVKDVERTGVRLLSPFQ